MDAACDADSVSAVNKSMRVNQFLRCAAELQRLGRHPFLQSGGFTAAQTTNAGSCEPWRR
jgi:hypothetical protein